MALGFLSVLFPCRLWKLCCGTVTGEVGACGAWDHIANQLTPELTPGVTSSVRIKPFQLLTFCQFLHLKTSPESLW